MIKLEKTKYDFANVIKSINPESKNIQKLVDRFLNIFDDIKDVLEDGFFENYFTNNHKKYDKNKNIYEGLWVLNVIWSLKSMGYVLEKPYTNDDAMININGEKIGVEIFFNGTGGPMSEVEKYNKEVDKSFYYSDTGFLICGISENPKYENDIINQIMNAIESKNKKLLDRKKESSLCRMLVMNEICLTNGGLYSFDNTSNRRDVIVKKVNKIKEVGFDILSYNSIGYGDYFSDASKLRFDSIIKVNF